MLARRTRHAGAVGRIAARARRLASAISLVSITLGEKLDAVSIVGMIACAAAMLVVNRAQFEVEFAAFAHV
ncbi:MULTISPECIES: hypothetical protein [unclassified Bradyrhizobium]|uniref:hypothetical protein n=1 Tax=unclassified Bradyrhizobium TaxID=2631580 RepID=UPI002FF3CB4E